MIPPEAARPSPALRVIFLGTPEFAVPSLRATAELTTVVGVVTQPDRPAGRGRRLTPPPVAVAARALGLALIQPESLRREGVVGELSARQPDLLITAAYGLLIPASVLALPPLGTVNVHPSLLPVYRGASPIQAAIADGAAVTGVTILHVVEALDAGDIIAQQEVAIGLDETAGELEARLAEEGASLLRRVIPLIAASEAPRRPQDHDRATYVGKVSKADGSIDWNLPAASIVNKVRAMSPWPSAFTRWRGSTLRIWRARAIAGRGEPGQVLAAGREGIVVAAGDGAVQVLEVQPEAGRRMSVADFLAGHRLQPGERLGREEPTV